MLLLLLIGEQRKKMLLTLWNITAGALRLDLFLMDKFKQTLNIRKHGCKTLGVQRQKCLYFLLKKYQSSSERVNNEKTPIRTEERFRTSSTSRLRARPGINTKVVRHWWEFKLIFNLSVNINFDTTWGSGLNSMCGPRNLSFLLF